MIRNKAVDDYINYLNEYSILTVRRRYRQAKIRNIKRACKKEYKGDRSAIKDCIKTRVAQYKKK